MQTSRFQLGLIVALAIGLGAALSSGPAVGYPTGAVSTGSNPIWNAGGRLNASSSVTLASAPADQDLILTDLLLTKDDAATVVELQLSDGTDVGRFMVRGGDSDKAAELVMHQYATGIRVPAGQTLTMSNTGSYYVYYAVAGYYAQP